MPFTNILKSFAIILAGSLTGYTSVKFFMPEPKNRSIASFPITKLGKEQSSRFLFDMSLNTDEISQTEDGVSTLKVGIDALKNFDDGLVYTWNLPADVQLIDGSLTGPLGAFSTHQNKEIVIKVRGFSKQLKKFISFEIKGAFAERPVHREILISSRIEDSFEYVIQQNELKRKKNLVNKLGSEKIKSKFSPDRIIR